MPEEINHNVFYFGERFVGIGLYNTLILIRQIDQSWKS